MRFQLNFVNSGGDFTIPINYQYYLHSWFYSVLNEADKDYAQWLHSRGFEASIKQGNIVKGKLFKLFTFSKLYFDKKHYRPVKNVIVVKSGALGHITMSFYIKDIAEKFIIGLFSGKEINIKGKKLDIYELRRLRIPEFKEEMDYVSRTPIKISVKDKNKISLPPDDEYFSDIFVKNLKNKALSLGLDYTDSKVSMKVISEFKSKLITIKPGSSKETKNKGFLFSFHLSAPVELQRLGYFGGFGENNAMGFGFVDIKK